MVAVDEVDDVDDVDEVVDVELLEFACHGGLNRLLVCLDLGDLGRGQPHARQHGGRVRLNLRHGGGAGQGSFADRIQVILHRADRGMRGLSSAGRVVLEVRLERLHGGLDGGRRATWSGARRRR